MNVVQKVLSVCLLCVSFGSANAESPMVNINAADAQSLAKTIVGIGPARAVAIVAFRDSNGPFNSVDDLMLVKDIGGSMVEKNRDKLTVKTQ